MKNKFEALTAFQSWPEDWQRLCAEYWTENDKPKVYEVALPTIGSPFPFDGASDHVAIENIQPKKPLPAGRFQQRWTTAQEEHLVACVDRCNTQEKAAREFLKRYPGRTVDAVKIKIRGMTRADGVMEVKY